MEKFTPEEEQMVQQAYRQGRLIGRLVRAEIDNQELLNLNIQISGELSKRQDVIDELSETANYDELTGLLSRKAFTATVYEYFGTRRRRNDDQRVHSLLVMDLDNFKLINDTLGHLAGDECIRHVGISIQKCLNRDLDFAGRWGGEEFTVMLGDTDLDDALTIAQNIRAEINQKIPGVGTDGELNRLGVTIGIAQYNHGSDFRAGFQVADEVLLDAKQHSTDKNQIIFARQPLPSDQR